VSDLNVVDSSGWLEYFMGSSRAELFAPAIEDTPNLIVPTISIYEIFKKLLRDTSEDDALKAISVMHGGRIVDLDQSLALESARHPLPLADSIIYATALRFDATLWTQDRDFSILMNVRYFAN
jgi:predicted nucleic acid-binding protein